MRIAVAVAHGLDNGIERPEVTAAWRAAWDAAGAAADSGNARQHPRVAPWRDRFRAIDVSPKAFPSSVEALLRRALKGGEPFRINPLVDFYNTVSLRHGVPAGGFDLDHLGDDLHLRLTRSGDLFHALAAAAPDPVPPGEVAYADGPTVLTRHFVWRQSRPGLITHATRSVILLAEVLAETGEDLVDLVLADLAGGLRDHFGASPKPSSSTLHPRLRAGEHQPRQPRCPRDACPRAQPRPGFVGSGRGCIPASAPRPRVRLWLPGDAGSV